MKRLVFWTGALLLPVLLTAGASMKVKNTNLDFGEVESGKIVDLSFEFVNSGNSPLVLKSVNPSCGCTTAEMKKMTFEPGEKGQIPVKFNSTGYSGKVQKLVTVLSNDAENPEIRLILSGTVTMKDFAQAELDNDRLVIGKVQMGKSYTRKVVLSNSGNLELRVLEVCAPPETTLTFSNRLAAPKTQLEMTVTFTPFEKGLYSTIIKIRTNDSRRAYLFLRVEAEVE